MRQVHIKLEQERPFFLQFHIVVMKIIILTFQYESKKIPGRCIFSITANAESFIFYSGFLCNPHKVGRFGMFQMTSKHFGLDTVMKAEHCEIKYQGKVGDILPLHYHCLGRQKQRGSIARMKQMTVSLLGSVNQ